MDGSATSVPAGIVMPFENVKGRSARRAIPTEIQSISGMVSMQSNQQTGRHGINSLGLPYKTVKLVHLIYCGLRPAFLFHCLADLLAERFEVLWMRNKAVTYLRERLEDV